jgi:hypothetical protein
MKTVCREPFKPCLLLFYFVSDKKKQTLTYNPFYINKLEGDAQGWSSSIGEWIVRVNKIMSRTARSALRTLF